MLLQALSGCSFYMRCPRSVCSHKPSLLSLDQVSVLPSTWLTVGCQTQGPAWDISPSNLLLELGTQEQVSEKKDVAQLPSPLNQLHHETVLQELPVLWIRKRWC